MISLVLTAVLLLFNRQILMIFGASENTIDYAVSYMNVYAIGTVFVQLTLGMNMFITAQGFAKTGMLTVLIGAVLNLALDPLFIFTFNMGVQGAALATILSQAVSCIWCIIFLCGRKTRLRLLTRNLTLRAKVIVPCVTLGLATFIMQISESIIAACFNSSLQKYGGDIAVGAMTICTSTMQFAMLPMQGIGQGAQPISSYNYGARNEGRVKETFIVAVVRKFVLLIPLIYIVPALNILPDKAHCVFLAEPVADVIAVIFTAVLFSFQFRKALKKLVTEEALSPGRC